ncbi:MAG: tetratricopeptide repeat protein [Gammaproteobacteria bacterium]|nr:tetratricopeptide repeat protein [Gammaproteobacteria bacterium]
MGNSVIQTIIKCLLLFSLVTSGVAFSIELNQIAKLAKGGAPELAISLLDQSQPSVEKDFVAWVQWEQQRAAIYTQWKEWDKLLLRLENLPENLPPFFVNWVIESQALAYLKLDQPNLALQRLRQLLWQEDTSGIYRNFPRWRRQLIEVYLELGFYDDSRRAIVRFSHDYPDRSQQVDLLKAKVLLESKRYGEVAELLSGSEEIDEILIRLYAELSGKAANLNAVITRIKKQLGEKGLSAADKTRFLWLLSLALERGGSEAAELIAMEQSIRLLSPVQMRPSLLRPSADKIWRNYVRLGNELGNRAELLTGDDEAWFALAKKVEAKSLVSARSLYAVLAQNARNKSMRSRAAIRLSELLLDKEAKDLERLNALEWLYLDAAHFQEKLQIPERIRYQLVDHVLLRGDIQLAKELMQGLEKSPSDQDQLEWNLRRARVQVLSGDYQRGSTLLSELLNKTDTLDKRQIDRVLQVVFDLQTVESHPAAIEHLNVLYGLALDAKQKREILYWLADSYKGLKQYHDASVLYLRSATLFGVNALDPWAQTALYNAAETLTHGGHLDDAKRIYEKLLKATDNPARRSLLRHNIQQLWLKNTLEQ